MNTSLENLCAALEKDDIVMSYHYAKDASFFASMCGKTDEAKYFSEIAEAIIEGKAENAELDAAREANRQNEYRIEELAGQIANVEFIKAHWFKIYNETEDEEAEYTLIGDDSNVEKNEISDTTPFGKVLATAKKGDRKKVVVGDDFYFIKILDDKIIEDQE